MFTCARCVARPLTRLSAVALRAAVAKLVGLRHTPELHFRCAADAAGGEAELRLAAAWELLDREREEEAATLRRQLPVGDHVVLEEPAALAPHGRHQKLDIELQ